ncbi:MAG: sigma factor-like helix-turn-helix DNA-binding protein [Pirellulales bacterium]
MAKQKRGRGRPPAPPLRLPASVIDRYIPGDLSKDQVAALAGAATTYRVTQALQAAGVHRDSSSVTRARNVAAYGQRWAEILLLRLEGLTQAEIGERLGISHQRVHQILKWVAQRHTAP